MSRPDHQHRTLRIPVLGAELHVEVRGHGPAIVLFGCPMDAAAFEPLADLLADDFTVITTDPRGIKRSTVIDRSHDVTPETLADDLSSIITRLAVGPAVVFGSSGGAVASLALTQQHPEHVRHVIAHEPPLEELLTDHERLRANTEDMVQTYLNGDIVGAWRRFFAGADIKIADENIAGWINGRTESQDAADEHFFFAHTLRPATYWIPDTPTLTEHAARITIGVGTASAGQICDRTTTALAAAIASTKTEFAGDHTGFVDHPAQFARQLKRVIPRP